jgi:hypothetical protein
MADENVPERLLIEMAERVEHFTTLGGALGLEIEAVYPGTTKRIILRVGISDRQFFFLQAQLEATRRHLNLPLPPIFSRQETRQ